MKQGTQVYKSQHTAVLIQNAVDALEALGVSGA